MDVDTIKCQPGILIPSVDCRVYKNDTTACKYYSTNIEIVT